MKRKGANPKINMVNVTRQGSSDATVLEDKNSKINLLCLEIIFWKEWELENYSSHILLMNIFSQKLLYKHNILYRDNPLLWGLPLYHHNS